MRIPRAVLAVHLAASFAAVYPGTARAQSANKAGAARGKAGSVRSAKGARATAHQTRVFARVKKMLIEQLEIAPEKVTAKARIKADLGADSLDLVELIMGLEEEFDIAIPDEAAMKFVTAGDVVTYISRVTGKPAPAKPKPRARKR